MMAAHYEVSKATNFDDVGDFHQKFDLDNVTHRGMGPRPSLDDSIIPFRIGFMLEERQEFCEAVGYKITLDHTGKLKLIKFRQSNHRVDHDLAFDALIDLVYVAMGTAHFMGYPWQLGWRLVQRANMGKVRARKDASDSKRGSSFDVVKPDGWKAPDIKSLLERAGFVFTEPHAAEDIDQGGYCNKLVLRRGHGDTCGLPKDDPVHTKVYGHDREGYECAPEFCGGTRNDPCLYTPEEIEHIRELEAEAEGRCPDCNSPNPKLHPAVQFEGEVQVCSNPFHEENK